MRQNNSYVAKGEFFVMINKYFDFQGFLDNEVVKDVSDWNSYIDDFEVALSDLKKEEAVEYISNIPFPMLVSECEINFESKKILFNFSEEYNESNESCSYIGYCTFYVVYSIKDECIIEMGYEQG